MIDQAATLRQLAHNTNKEQKPQIISIVLGKAGEEDLSITVKLGEELAIKKKKVLIIVDTMEKVLIKSQPFINILSCLSTERNFKDYLIDGPFDIKILQVLSDGNQISPMDEKNKRILLEKLRNIGDFDYILIHAGAGITISTLSFISISNMVYVLTNPQISSITEGYSLIKAINHFKLQDKVKLIVYKARNIQEGSYTYNNIKNVSEKFLDITIEYSGVIVGNLFLEEDGWNQEALLDTAAITSASDDIERIAAEVLTSQMD